MPEVEPDPCSLWQAPQDPPFGLLDGGWAKARPLQKAALIFYLGADGRWFETVIWGPLREIEEAAMVLWLGEWIEEFQMAMWRWHGHLLRPKIKHMRERMRETPEFRKELFRTLDDAGLLHLTF